MRKLILFFVLLFSLSAQAQDVKSFNKRVKAQRAYLDSLKGNLQQATGRGFARINMASAYEKFNQAVKDGRKELRRGADFVLDPITVVNFDFLTPTASGGSWGDEYLEIENRYKEIKDRAQNGGRMIRAVVFDTGQPDHRQVNDVLDNTTGRIWTADSSAIDVHSHSSHVTGIIIGADNEANRSPLTDGGRLELAWQKVLSDRGGGSYSKVAEAVRYENKISAEKIAKGYFVIYNFSLGGGTSLYEPLEKAFEEAVNMGVLVLTSAGNTGGSMTYPSLSPYALGVGSLAQSGGTVKKASYSAYGPKLWGSAPGSNIYSIIPGGGYAHKSGTSMACPQMIAVISIVASLNPTASAADIINHFEKYGTDLPPDLRDDKTGWGVPIINALIDNKVGEGPPPPPPPPKEICNDGKDNDEDGLVDCKDPDCFENDNCKSEPPPPPPPIVKPARIYRAQYPVNDFHYEIKYRVPGDEPGQYRRLLFRLEVEAEAKENMAVFAARLNKAVEQHFKSRTYGLVKNADFWDAAYWAAFFFDIIEGKKFAKLRVIKIDCVDELGNTATLDNTQLKNLEGLRRYFIKDARKMRLLNKGY